MGNVPMEDRARVERNPQVIVWLAKLDEELHRADGLFKNVRDSLGFVLREEPLAVDVCPDTVEEEVLVPLARLLREYTLRLSDVSGRYENMLSLLEL